jgi:hypothetical protein
MMGSRERLYVIVFAGQPQASPYFARSSSDPSSPATAFEIATMTGNAGAVPTIPTEPHSRTRRT